MPQDNHNPFFSFNDYVRYLDNNGIPKTIYMAKCDYVFMVLGEDIEK